MTTLPQSDHSLQAPATTPATAPTTTTTRPPLPKTFTHTSPKPTLHFQGAEALLYHTYYLTYPSTSTPTALSTTAPATGPLPAALKYRPPKPYRHPLLDSKLTRHRLLSEARVLAKLRREGVGVPALYALDAEGGWLMMEWVEGGSVRGVLDRELGRWLEGEGERDAGSGEVSGEEVVVGEGAVNTGEGTGMGKEGRGLWGLMGRIGKTVGRMHQMDVVHGDLTTSNLLLRPSTRQHDPTHHNTADGDSKSEAQDLEGEVVLIDFGLAGQSADVEDRAVDLYVLERAFGSTHRGTERLFGEVLRAYRGSYKGAGAALRRYEDVRMRGRKKIVLG